MHAKDEPSKRLSYVSSTRKTLNKKSRKPAVTVWSILIVLVLYSDKPRDTTDRHAAILHADSLKLFRWHKDSESNYMSKLKIHEMRMPEQKGRTYQRSSPFILMSSPQYISLRSKTPQIDWDQCNICQQDKKIPFGFIHKMKVSNRILKVAHYVQFLRWRMLHECCLISTT